MGGFYQPTWFDCHLHFMPFSSPFCVTCARLSMELAKTIYSPPIRAPTSAAGNRKCFVSYPPKAFISSLLKTDKNGTAEKAIPTMFDIVEASRRQNLDIQLERLGPFFRITAKSLATGNNLGKAEGFTRLWFGGKILHLDSIRLQRETLGMEKSIFGIGLFIGAMAIRYGYECGCKKAELLAINDTEVYHSKLVRFYTRIGFKAVHEVKGGTLGDLGHMLVWGGIGTRMDADVEALMMKWCSRFQTSRRSN